MSDKEALLHFERKEVSSSMVQYLVEVTNSIIKIKPSRVYPSPPDSPIDDKLSLEPKPKPLVSLYEFIRGLIGHSKVPTPTLMTTLVYLGRLKAVLPSNVYGIETTRHRIFLGCLVLCSKFLNDSSPLNKHWAKYTNGLLTVEEVNTIERELLDYLDWKLDMTNDDLVNSLSHFLIPIKEKLQKEQETQILQRQQQYMKSSISSVTLNSLLTSSESSKSLRPSSSALSNRTPISNSISTTSIQSSTAPSLMSASSSRSTLSSLATSYKSSNSISNLMREPIAEGVDFYSPTKPLRIRSSNENNRNLTKSTKSFNLSAAGSIIHNHTSTMV